MDIEAKVFDFDLVNDISRNQLEQHYQLYLGYIKLHELYFGNLAKSNEKPSRTLLRLLERDFGTYNNWAEDFFRCGVAARGWAILSFDFRDLRLHNIMQGAHNEGSIWQARPLLVLDVYEHAYLIDFGIDRKKYLNIFFENINWMIVNRRVEYLYPYL